MTCNVTVIIRCCLWHPVDLCHNFVLVKGDPYVWFASFECPLRPDGQLTHCLVSQNAIRLKDECGL